MIYGAVAVVVAIVVVAGRYLVSAGIQKLHQQVLSAEKAARQVKLEVKAAENKRSVAELELKKEEGNRKKIERVIQTHDKELGA